MTESGPPDGQDVPEQHQSASAVDHIIPIKNPVALLSYYFGVFALIPLMGVFFGLAAVPMGIIGLAKVRQSSGLPGTAHAWAGIVLGFISVAAHVAGVIWLLGAKAR